MLSGLAAGARSCCVALDTETLSNVLSSIQMTTPIGVAYHPSVPRHLQIQRVLRGRIESGEWAGDHPIPTEMELLAEFGVSRTTIREALGVLTRDGLIARHRGRGSFVQPRVNGRPAVTNLI